MLTPRVHIIQRPLNDYQRAVLQIQTLRMQLQKAQELNMKLDKEYGSLVKRLRDLEVYVSGCEKQLEAQHIYIKSMRKGESK